eukprot:Blabericola_migrator_1__2062@NODE_1567_length_4264_cov_6_167977_g1024_i0_p1_GENE_NODE_1567_length_4264_cov_6_167977_g1024_i0NODE_1567_length_4264_cov_6_167977_g1024_i0_p1_ORF_typecomplete_len545_score85_57Reprolysin_3/PF13582_6/9_3e02Reprolysin_3/PF13582_6/12_NODE_1567_length_4264_cov_6_167977_g1024_i016043238
MFKVVALALLSVSCLATDVSGYAERGTFVNWDEIDELLAIDNATLPAEVVLPLNSTWTSINQTSPANLDVPIKLEIVKIEDYDEMHILLGHLTYGSGDTALISGDTAVAKSVDGIAIQIALNVGVSWSISSSGDSNDSMIGSQVLEQCIDHAITDFADHGSGYTDLDSDGSYLIDVMCVFTPSSINVAKDLQGLCRSHTEMVNLALLDSGISDIRLRALPIYDWHADVAPGAGQMSGVRKSLEEHREDMGADLVVVFTNMSPGFADTEQQGFLTIVTMDVPASFRHFVGHNIGFEHCTNKTAADIMCLNQEGLYNDVNNLWRTRAAEVSSYMPSMKSADGSFGTKLAKAAVGTTPVEFLVKGGANKMIIILRVDDIADKTKDVTVYARQGVFNVSSTAYTHAATGPGTAILTIENPAAGRWTAIGSAPVAAKISVYLYITDTGVPDLLCDAKAEAGAGRGTYEKWLTASITARDDGTDDLINFTWAIKEDPHSVMSLMPGGAEGASTLIYYDGPENQTYSGGVVTLTCVDTYYNVSKSIDISLD